mgnify:FL=1|jgi:hypothetical protein
MRLVLIPLLIYFIGVIGFSTPLSNVIVSEIIEFMPKLYSLLPSVCWYPSTNPPSPALVLRLFLFD